jgi:5-formyltetrahydrofolate cyclo-ligase
MMQEITKKDIRRLARAAIKDMSNDEKMLQATLLCSAALEHPLVQSARVVALFSPLPDEPDVSH